MSLTFIYVILFIPLNRSALNHTICHKYITVIIIYIQVSIIYDKNDTDIVQMADYPKIISISKYNLVFTGNVHL